MILKKPLTGKNKADFVKQVKTKLFYEEMSYEDLGKKIGFATRTISNNMSSDRMSKFVASAIAEELGIDISKYEKGENDGRTAEE